MSNEILDHIGFYFHLDYKVLICASCGFSYFPNAVLGHVRQAHLIKITKDQQEAYDKTVDQLKPSTHHCFPPPPGKVAVELLNYCSGVCCNFCSFCCPLPNSFANHWSKEHRDMTVSPSDRSHIGTLQTFFFPTHRRYFEIIPPPKPAKSLYEIYLQTVVPTFKDFEVSIPTNEREIPPLLTQTQWHTHLADYVKNKSLCTKLVSLTSPPAIQHSILGKLVMLYLNNIRAMGKQSPMIVRCLLMECPR
jgi:hypothetical protein